MICTHKKSNRRYLVLRSDIIDATNETEGRKMIMYTPQDEKGEIYVRELKEFQEKFDITG